MAPETGFVSAVLPFVLAIVMSGLGLSLRPLDITRVVREPRAVLVTLGCQIVIMPAVCFGLVTLVGLEEHLALGMMILAASPGGVMAAILSHLARGDVALNVTVTAINSVLALVTVPVVTAFAVSWFTPDEVANAVSGADKIGVVAVAMIVPVALGMTVRWRWPEIAERLDVPVRRISVLAVLGAIVGAIVPQLAVFLHGLVTVGLVAVAFCLINLAVGYGVPRLARVGHRRAIAAAMELSVHNAIVAITVAATVLADSRAVLAPAMYGALMFGPPAALAWWLARRARDAPGPAAPDREARPA